MLYKELYYRHIHAKMQPEVDDRFDSFQNYVELFNLLLSLSSSEPEFELPVSWLWDILDEFIYQVGRHPDSALIFVAGSVLD